MSIETNRLSKLNSEWLLGGPAAENLLEIAEVMHLRILEDARNRTANGALEKFTPWMCDIPKQNRLLKLYSQPLPRILCEKQVLESLQESLESENRILDLGIDEDIPTVIDQGSKAFAQRYEAAAAILFAVCPWIQKIEKSLVSHVIPVRTQNTKLDRIGFSTHLLKGAMFFMFSESENEYSPFERAIDIAHEIGHQTLMVYLSCDRMISSSHLDLVFSGARSSSRDSIRCLHAATALAYEIETACSLLPGERSAYVRQELVSFVDQKLPAQRATLKSLVETCQFTEFGEVYLRELSEHLEIRESESIQHRRGIRHNEREANEPVEKQLHSEG